MRTLKLAAAVIALLALLPISPASAETWTKKDANGAVSWGGDIATVEVTNARRTVVVNTSMHYDKDPGRFGQLTVFLDTHTRGGTVPEFRITYEPSTDRLTVHRIARWTDTGGRLRHCAGDDAWHAVSARAVHVKVPRWCLKIAGEPPRAVRVAVRTSGPDGRRPVDWMPGAVRFPAHWVAHN